MPTLTMGLVSYEETVSEPLKKQMLLLLGGKVNYISSAGKKLTNSEGVDLDNSDDARVTILDKDWEPRYTASNVSQGNDRYSVIADEEIGLAIKLADIEREFTMSISKKFNTRGEAIWWRNNILGTLRDGTANHAVDLTINPTIPAKLLELVEACRIRKEQRGCETRNFMEYLLAISSSNLSLDTNSTRSSVALSFPEKLLDCTFSLPNPAPEPSIDDGMYLIEFEVTTIIRLPTACTVRYPNFIGGIQMPPAMVDKSIDVNNEKVRELNTSGFPLDSLLSMEMPRHPDYRDYCYQLPAFENSRFPFRRWNLSPIFQVKIDGELSNPREVCNLNDLFVDNFMGFKLNKEMLRYITKHRNDCLKISGSAVSVVLLKNGEMINDDLLYIDDELRLRTTYDMDMLGCYHLVLATPLQTAAIPEHIFETLEEFPELTNDLIKHTNPSISIEELPDVPKVTKPIYRPVFEKIINIGGYIGPITANTLIVQHRKV